MDAIFLFGICFTFTIILLSLIYQIPKATLKLPPGKTGLPIIGQTTEFISYPEKFITERMNKYSPDVFKTSLAGEKMVIFCGPSGNKFLFSNEMKLVKSWLPRSIADALSHPTTNCGTPSRKLADEISLKFLKLDSIQHFVPLMDSMVCEHLDASWSPFDKVQVFPLAKDFTFTLSCRIFVNYAYPSIEQVKELAVPFYLLIQGIFSAPVNIPGMAFHKAMKGGELVKERLLNIIRQRKRGIQEKGTTVTHEVDDLMGRMIRASDGDGESISNDDIASKIIGFMFASFYTTSSTITFVMSYLADHPTVYENVLKEQLQIIEEKNPGELLTWIDIQKMKYSWNVVCETMRLRPPSVGSFKEAIKDFTYETFNIPKGYKVHWSVHSTNKNPKYFTNPEEFDPSRFEGTGPAPFTFVPFGGGPRMCAGKEYARMETLVFLHNIVTRFKFTKLNPNEKIIYNPDPFLTEGLRISLHPHGK
ncbi:hypothetical protein KSS87_021459 [Heliosperma pusillum]|nr:hypothetical protein KSS87_013471 [Heliosperma pusillum]KAH9613483.1 hypothetical protein KSS87_021459 [Heliosperma pusillum]